MRPFRATINRFPRKLVVCRECQIPIEPVRHHLIPREGRELIFEIWVCCFYHPSNTINLVTATKYTAFGVIEYCIFMKDLADCSATTHGVIFAKYRRSDYEAARSICCWTSCSPFQIVGREPPALANFMTFLVATLAFFNSPVGV